MLIEAFHQLTHPISALQSCCVGRLRKGLSCHHGQQGFGSSHHIQPLARRFHQSLQFSLFLLAHGAQGMFLGLCHCFSPSLTPPVYHFRTPPVSPWPWAHCEAQLKAYL